MAENLVCPGLNLVLLVEVHRQARCVAVEKIMNGGFHGIAGRLLLTPLIDSEFFLLQGLEKVSRDSLDPLDVGRGQLVLPE